MRLRFLAFHPSAVYIFPEFYFTSCLPILSINKSEHLDSICYDTSETIREHHTSPDFMRISLVVALLAILFSDAFAQTEKSLQSKITSATVFNDRALVTRSAGGSFAVGKYNLRIAGLPLLLNDQSVRVLGKGMAHAKILEVRVEIAQLDSVSDVGVKELQNKLKQVQDEIRKNDDRRAVVSQQKDFLNRISIASSENISKDLRVQRPSVDDWQKVMSFLDASFSRLSSEQRDLDAKRDELRKKADQIQFELNNIGAPKQPREKQVVIGLDVAKEGKLDLEVSYLIQNASWQPMYDVRALTSEKKIELTYNAQVWQNTGEDWKDVMLTLSTAQPIIGGNQPTLATWFIDVFGGTKGAIQGFVRDIASGEPLGGANIVVEGKNVGATTDPNGLFVIQDLDPGDYSLRVSFIGYQSKTVRAQVAAYRTSRVDAVLDAVSVDMQGITVTGERPLVEKRATNAARVESQDAQIAVRGGRSGEVGYFMDGASARFETARVQSGTTSTAFEIVAKATVPSNNTKRKVTITVASLSGDFRYSSVPKLEPRAFFKTNVKNSTEFPFLDGSMSVFVDNSYVGNSHMPTVMPNEMFDAFLGVDDGIKVERKILNKLTETTGFFSKSKKTTYDVVIKVENLKKTAETITIQDNVPISRHEKIKVEIESPKPSELQPTADGFLVWNLELKPGEKKEVRLKFSVEYPTDMTVSALE